MKKAIVILIALLVILMLAITCFADAEEKANTIKLKIYDRITLADILPARESRDRAIVIDDIRDKVQLTQEDLEKYEVVTLPDGRIRWSDEGNEYEIEVTFTNLEVEVLKDAFNKLDREKKMLTTKRFLDLDKKIRAF